MVRLQFRIPDYLGEFGWNPGAGVRQQIALTLANAHATAVEDTAKANAPSESGRLRASIRAYLYSEKLGVLEATAPHARYLHEGTGIYGPKRKPIEITPKDQKALSWPGAKHPVKRVRQKGIKPNDFLRMAMQQKRIEDRMRLIMTTLVKSSSSMSSSEKCLYGCHQPSPPPKWDMSSRREATPGDWSYPLLHPIQFYNSADKIRRWGHDVFEENSYQRHYHASYILTREYGPGWTRLMGVLNEIQGFLWHDIWHLRSRLRGKSPWAFQFDDLAANEQGIRDAMRKEE